MFRWPAGWMDGWIAGWTTGKGCDAIFVASAAWAYPCQSPAKSVFVHCLKQFDFQFAAKFNNKARSRDRFLITQRVSILRILKARDLGGSLKDLSPHWIATYTYTHLIIISAINPTRRSVKYLLINKHTRRLIVTKVTGEMEFFPLRDGRHDLGILWGPRSCGLSSRWGSSTFVGLASYS